MTELVGVPEPQNWPLELSGDSLVVASGAAKGTLFAIQRPGGAAGPVVLMCGPFELFKDTPTPSQTFSPATRPLPPIAQQPRLALAPAVSAMPLPPGFERRVHTDGRAYYVNHNAGTTSWEPPRRGAAPARSQSAATQASAPVVAANDGAERSQASLRAVLEMQQSGGPSIEAAELIFSIGGVQVRHGDIPQLSAHPRNGLHYLFGR